MPERRLTITTIGTAIVIITIIVTAGGATVIVTAVGKKIQFVA
jgi:hypothetical protein